MRTSLKAALVILISAVILLLSGVGIIYYNHHFSPLAKLRNKITTGQDFELVFPQFKAVAEKYKNDEIQFNHGVIDKANPEGIPAGTKFLHLYHWVLLDDIQLTVYFDKANKVIKIDFIGD